MNYYVIPAALTVTFLILLILSLFSKRPMSGLWIFFLIIFLATWTGQLWITPFGPVVWGIAWIPLFIVALFFSFLIFALLPPIVVVTKAEENKEEEGPAIVFGTFFWIMLILLIISIVVGYYRIV